MKYSGWSESFSNLLASSCMLSFIFKIAADSVWSCKESDLLVGKCQSTKHRGPQGNKLLLWKQKISCMCIFFKKQTNQGGDVYRNRSSSDWEFQLHLLFGTAEKLKNKWWVTHSTWTPEHNTNVKCTFRSSSVFISTIPYFLIALIFIHIHHYKTKYPNSYIYFKQNSFKQHLLKIVFNMIKRHRCWKCWYLKVKILLKST